MLLAACVLCTSGASGALQCISCQQEQPWRLLRFDCQPVRAAAVSGEEMTAYQLACSQTMPVLLMACNPQAGTFGFIPCEGLKMWLKPCRQACLGCLSASMQAAVTGSTWQHWGYAVWRGGGWRLTHINRAAGCANTHVHFYVHVGVVARSSSVVLLMRAARYT